MEAFKYSHERVVWGGIEQVVPFVIMKGFKYWIIGTSSQKTATFHELRSARTNEVRSIEHSDLCKRVDKS